MPRPAHDRAWRRPLLPPRDLLPRSVRPRHCSAIWGQSNKSGCSVQMLRLRRCCTIHLATRRNLTTDPIHENIDSAVLSISNFTSSRSPSSPSITLPRPCSGQLRCTGLARLALLQQGAPVSLTRAFHYRPWLPADVSHIPRERQQIAKRSYNYNSSSPPLQNPGLLCSAPRTW